VTPRTTSPRVRGPRSPSLLRRRVQGGSASGRRRTKSRTGQLVVQIVFVCGVCSFVWCVTGVSGAHGVLQKRPSGGVRIAAAGVCCAVSPRPRSASLVDASHISRWCGMVWCAVSRRDAEAGLRQRRGDGIAPHTPPVRRVLRAPPQPLPLHESCQHGTAMSCVTAACRSPV
jgi:hypothetical protein